LLKRILIILFLIAASGVNPGIGAKNHAAGPEQPTRILVIFDASQSMYARWQTDTRINIARNILNELLDSLQSIDNVQVALRVFGHQKRYPPQDCDDTKLEVPFRENNISRIRNRLRTITPRGTTPIAASLEEAANDFPPCEDCRNIVVLITDGIEECGGDPCEASRRLQQKGIVLRPFVIGIGRDFREEFECVGHYFDGSSESEFEASLNIIISQIISSTTSQVNLLDVYGNPSESNVPITFYDHHTGKIKQNFVHTLNHRGLPDTLYFLDPVVTYDMVVHSTPQVRVNGIELVSGTHNIIAADAGRGTLRIKTDGPSPVNHQIIVREKGSMETLRVQSLNQSLKYLTGNYDLEVLSIPKIHIKDVEVKHNHETVVEISQPGIAVIRLPGTGYATILHNKDGELIPVHTLQENIINQTLYLQPGNYRLVYRSRVSSNTAFSVDRPFVIKPGASITVSVN